MKHLIFLVITIIFYSVAINAQTEGDTIVLKLGNVLTMDTILLDNSNTKVISYGSSKIFTITDVELMGQAVRLSYKSETTTAGKPMIISVCMGLKGSFPYVVTAFHYYNNGAVELRDYKNDFTMSENSIMFSPKPGPDHTGKVFNISGNYLVRVFLVWRTDMMERPYKAISNVAQLEMKF